jgi:tripartite-type tricarboxylate transporter receptor subunit TctC
MIPGSIAGAVLARCWRSVLLALGASLATAGIGTVQHLVAATLSRAAGVEMIHVPYANSGQALKDVQSRAVPVYFAFLGPIDGMLKSGQLKPLAVATRRRTSA